MSQRRWRRRWSGSLAFRPSSIRGASLSVDFHLLPVAYNQSSTLHQTCLALLDLSAFVSDPSFSYLTSLISHLHNESLPSRLGQSKLHSMPSTCLSYTDWPLSPEMMFTAHTTTPTSALKTMQAPFNILSHPSLLVLQSSASSTRTVLSLPPTT